MGRSPRARDVLRIGLAVVVLLAIYTTGSIERRRGVRPAVEPASKPDSPDRRASANGREAAGRSVSIAGVTVAVDPRTGRLRRPTASQRVALADALRRQFGRQPMSDPIYFLDKTISLVVGSENLNFSIARMENDGEVDIRCVTGIEQATTVLEHGLGSENDHLYQPEE